MVEQRTIENSMFADSLLDTSRGQRSRRSWTTLTSFGLEAIVIGLLLLLPLLQTVVLPSARSVSTPVTLGQPAAQPAAPRPRSGGVSVAPNTFVFTQILHPSYIPRSAGYPTVEGTDQPPCISGCGAPVGNDHGILDGLPVPTGSVPVMPARPAAPTRAIRASSLLEGNLIRRVQPVYPPSARNARIQGSVVLSALISKQGTIENLQVLSGHPLLVQAAIEAVKQWRYRPYILNSEPVEVETQITVNFTLGNR
jgi:periplasmic protein TonB